MSDSDGDHGQSRKIIKSDPRSEVEKDGATTVVSIALVAVIYRSGTPNLNLAKISESPASTLQ